MTVISTIMSSYGTAHASDSLIAERLASGAYKYIEHTRSKIIPVLHFKGAMSYWGLAKHGRWSTHEFLRSSASRARDYQSAELFAHYVADALNIGLQRTGLLTDKRAGIGIHFTAYEHVNGYWIPELFIMTNWTDPSYTEVFPTGVAVTRETYHTITTIPKHESHRNIECRLVVRDYLNAGRQLSWNNGDPVLFNPAAHAINEMILRASLRGLVIDPSPSTLLAMARLPVEVVIKIQRELYKSGCQVVGGALHDLAILPNGNYHSTTGDA